MNKHRINRTTDSLQWLNSKVIKELHNVSMYKIQHPILIGQKQSELSTAFSPFSACKEDKKTNAESCVQVRFHMFVGKRYLQRKYTYIVYEREYRRVEALVLSLTFLV